MDDETRKDFDAKTRAALGELDQFLLDHEKFSDDREVRCITPFAEDENQLTLGNVRVLSDLARAGAAMMLLQEHSEGQPAADDPVRSQARRYLEAMYGKAVWFRAPETFGNVLERWILAVALGDTDFAGKQMARIEELAAEVRDQQS